MYTGFQRRGFLQIISIYQYFRDIWILVKITTFEIHQMYK